MPDEPSASVLAPVDPAPALPYTNPLTGEGCETDIGQNRPIAIMLNNHKKAMPQLGVSQADIIYEMPAEGGITRMMGLFQSAEGVGQIGTVRSARDYYVSLAYGHDAIYLHAGGSPQAYDAIQNWGVTALDCVNGPYEGTLFWRDKLRRKNAGLEHSVLTSGDKIQELLPTYKRVKLTHREGYDPALRFLGPDETAAGSPCDAVTVKFSSYKTGVFTYDSDSGRYLVKEYGKPYIDGNTGEQVGVTNVLVLKTSVTNTNDQYGHVKVDLVSGGEGYFACGGKIIPIRWSKGAPGDPIRYTDTDGNAIALGTGVSYVCLVPLQSDVTFE